MSQKPNSQQAMRLLLNRITQSIPLNLPEASICAGKCIGCPKKLVEMLDTEVSYWQNQSQQITPGLADLKALEKLARRCYKVFDKNGLLNR